jgi:uncharacterized SAM-dependent methyltransferase
MTRQLDETADEFALRVSQTMSRTANVVLTNYTSHDVVELTKRHVREQRLRSQSSAQSTNLSRKHNSCYRYPDIIASQLDEMAMRIKETFPHVTLHAIRADLGENNVLLQLYQLSCRTFKKHANNRQSNT